MPVKPSDKEEEYFARIEMERRRKTEEERIKAIEIAERQRLKEMHFMRCPKCGMELQEVDVTANARNNARPILIVLQVMHANQLNVMKKVFARIQN